MRPLGLSARVVLGAVLVLLVGVLAIGVTVNVLLTDRLAHDVKAVLRARADAQATTVRLRGARVIVIEGTGAEALDREAWVFAGGREVARPIASPDARRVARGLGRVTATTLRDVPGGRIRLLGEPVRMAGGRQYATVVVGLTLTPYESTERLARLATILLGAFVVLAGALIARRSVAAGLRPVAEMARRAEDYGEHDLAARFAHGQSEDELAALADTLNGLLGRLEAGLRREQRLSAEIAHELRTPLSGIRATAEVGLLGDRPTEMREALQVVIESADRMGGAIDALVTTTRDPGAGGATCWAHEAVAAAVDALVGVALQRGVALQLRSDEPGARVGAEATVLTQAVSPLIENAIRHARARVEVEVEVVTGDEVVRVIVQDDGPGIAEPDVEAIFEPGVQRPGGGSGAGLGLALVRRLASAMGGQVRAEPAVVGARLVLELPLLASGSGRAAPGVA